MSRKISIVSLLSGASLLACPLAAHAQAADAPAAADNETIIVTGSRTIRNGDASPTPVTVVTTETLTNVRPTSLTESLTILPVFSGVRGQTSNPSATGGVGGGNGNAAQLNLRNIGSLRTLVLMDGRRVPPASFSNIVDADVIPQQLIQRVDVVTGGVSAVYGSDAVSGVVNFITNTRFQGLKLQAQAGISHYGDGRQVMLAGAYGTSFADGRGHFTASYEYRDDQGVLSRSSRPWFTRPVVSGSGTTASPYTLVENATLNNQPFGGRLTCANLPNSTTNGCPTINGQYFASDGVLAPFSNTNSGYLDHSLKSKQRSHQAYGRVEYALTDGVRAFAIGSANFKKNAFYADEILLNVTLSRTNANLATVYQNQIASSTFSISETLRGAQFEGVPESRLLMGTLGLESTGGPINWDIAYVYGDSRLKTTLNNNVNNQKLSAALDVVQGANGPVCYASTVSSAYSNCAPLNIFGPTAASAQALDYITDSTTYVATTRQHDIVASVSGSPFSTWAGDVTTALSGEWRYQSFASVSDARPDMFASCDSLVLRYNCNASGASRTFLYRNTFAQSPKISQSVWEIAGEATVPLLRDAPLIQRLDANGAVRYTKYNTVGSYWTWKGGLDWQVTNDLRLRGTISRDIRAPTLDNLFAPTSVVLVNNNDIKTGAINGVDRPSVNQSNPQLTAEIGNTKTIGLVYKPSYAPGFSLAVDYYDIKLSNAIVTLQGFQATTQQGCLNGVALYCSLIQRDATSGQVTQWFVRPVNLAKVTTYGVDIEANYNGKLAGNPMALRFLAAYQPHIRYIQPDTPTLDQGGVAFGPTGLTASPTWRLTGTASYQPTDSFRFDLMYRWRNRLKMWGASGIVWATGQDGTMAPFGQASLNLSWQPEASALGKPEFFLNIQNLFNANPPLGNAANSTNAPGGFNGFAATDDPIGRYFTAGFRVKM